MAELVQVMRRKRFSCRFHRVRVESHAPYAPEAIALGKRNKDLTLKVIAKQMKVIDRKRLDVIYDASLGRMSSKPYPREEAVQLELESIAFTDALFKNKKASEFMDNSIIAELDRKGFFAKLQ